MRDKTQEPETRHQNRQSNQERDQRGPGIFGSAYDRCARCLWRRRVLQIGIAIDREVAGSFKSVEIGRNINLEKFAVDLQKSLGVGQTRKVRKIVRFDLGQARLSNSR